MNLCIYPLSILGGSSLSFVLPPYRSKKSCWFVRLVSFFLLGQSGDFQGSSLHAKLEVLSLFLYISVTPHPTLSPNTNIPPCLGPLLGSPVQDVAITLHSLIIHPGTSSTMISACVSRCVQKVYNYSDLFCFKVTLLTVVYSDPQAAILVVPTLSLLPEPCSQREFLPWRIFIFF